MEDVDRPRPSRRAKTPAAGTLRIYDVRSMHRHLPDEDLIPLNGEPGERRTSEPWLWVSVLAGAVALIYWAIQMV